MHLNSMQAGAVALERVQGGWAQVSALGFVSVFDQVLEGLPTEEQDAIFKAYVGALDEDAGRYRRDAEAWESWAKGLSGAGLCPTGSGPVLLPSGACEQDSNDRTCRFACTCWRGGHEMCQ